jgi:hypothetical protein
LKQPLIGGKSTEGSNSVAKSVAGVICFIVAILYLVPLMIDNTYSIVQQLQIQHQGEVLGTNPIVGFVAFFLTAALAFTVGSEKMPPVEVCNVVCGSDDASFYPL